MSLKIAAVVFCEIFLAAVLRQYKPEFVPVSVLACCALLAAMVSGELLRVSDAFSGILGTVGPETAHLTAMLKILGTTLVTQFAADTARDNGETAFAGYIEFTGKLLAASLSLPIFRALLQTVSAMLEGL